MKKTVPDSIEEGAFFYVYLLGKSPSVWTDVKAAMKADSPPRRPDLATGRAESRMNGLSGFGR